MAIRQIRQQTVASVAALRLVSQELQDGDSILVKSSNAVYTWDSALTNTDDGSQYIKSDHLATGRWYLSETGTRSANTYYIDPNGDNTSGTGDDDSPLQGLASALTKCPSGGEIRVNPGTYGAGNITKNNITITGTSGAYSSLVNVGLITVNAPSGTSNRIANLTIKGGLDTTGGSAPLYLNNVTLEGNVDLSGVYHEIRGGSSQNAVFRGIMAGGTIAIFDSLMGEATFNTPGSTVIIRNTGIDVGKTVTIGAGVIYSATGVTGNLDIDPAAISAKAALIGSGLSEDDANIAIQTSFDAVTVKENLLVSGNIALGRTRLDIAALIATANYSDWAYRNWIVLNPVISGASITLSQSGDNKGSNIYFMENSTAYDITVNGELFQANTFTIALVNDNTGVITKVDAKKSTSEGIAKDPDPATNLTGFNVNDLAFDTTDKELQYWDGASWSLVAGASSGGGGLVPQLTGANQDIKLIDTLTAYVTLSGTGIQPGQGFTNLPAGIDQTQLTPITSTQTTMRLQNTGGLQHNVASLDFSGHLGWGTGTTISLESIVSTEIVEGLDTVIGQLYRITANTPLGSDDPSNYNGIDYTGQIYEATAAITVGADAKDSADYFAQTSYALNAFPGFSVDAWESSSTVFTYANTTSYTPYITNLYNGEGVLRAFQGAVINASDYTVSNSGQTLTYNGATAISPDLVFNGAIRNFGATSGQTYPGSQFRLKVNGAVVASRYVNFIGGQEVDLGAISLSAGTINTGDTIELHFYMGGAFTLQISSTSNIYFGEPPAAIALVPWVNTVIGELYEITANTPFGDDDPSNYNGIDYTGQIYEATAAITVGADVKDNSSAFTQTLHSEYKFPRHEQWKSEPAFFTYQSTTWAPPYTTNFYNGEGDLRAFQGNVLIAGDFTVSNSGRTLTYNGSSQVNGYLMFSGTIHQPNGTDGLNHTGGELRLKVNGSIVDSVPFTSIGQQSADLSGIALNAGAINTGDTIELYLYKAGGFTYEVKATSNVAFV